MWRVIEALLILHNICIYYGDQPGNIEEFIVLPEDSNNGTDGDLHVEIPSEDLGTILNQPANIPAQKTERWLKAEGHKLQKQIMDDVFSIENYL